MVSYLLNKEYSVKNFTQTTKLIFISNSSDPKVFANATCVDEFLSLNFSQGHIHWLLVAAQDLQPIC